MDHLHKVPSQASEWFASNPFRSLVRCLVQCSLSDEPMAVSRPRPGQASSVSLYQVRMSFAFSFALLVVVLQYLFLSLLVRVVSFGLALSSLIILLPKTYTLVHHTLDLS